MNEEIEIAQSTVGFKASSKNGPRNGLRTAVPLEIEFAPGSQIVNAPSVSGAESAVGTFIEFADGDRVAVPSDQVVQSEEGVAGATIGLGGMTFEGVEGERLVFFRVRDLLPKSFSIPPAAIKSRFRRAKSRPCACRARNLAALLTTIRTGLINGFVASRPLAACSRGRTSESHPSVAVATQRVNERGERSGQVANGGAIETIYETSSSGI